MQYSVVFLCILVILIVILLVSIKIANQQLSSLFDINYKTGVCFFFFPTSEYMVLGNSKN